MHEEIKACPICGEPNRPIFPHCTKCRAGKYCEKCKRKHSILADFCDECITADGVQLDVVRLDMDPEDNPVRSSGVDLVYTRKRKFISASLVVVCVSLVIGTLFAVNTTGKVSSSVGVDKSLANNMQGLIPPVERPAVQPGPRADLNTEFEKKTLVDDSIHGPELPYEDIGACPFEGCTYRCWTANKDTVIRSGQNAKSPVSFTVKKGEQVVGVTGTVITNKAGRARILKNMQIAGVKADAGRIVYLLTYLGEGYYKAWYGGKIIDSVDINKFKLIEKPKYTWWVTIKEKDGQTGWSNQPENFDHKDTLE